MHIYKWVCWCCLAYFQLLLWLMACASDSSHATDAPAVI
jgi:hypothetical protein